MLERLTKDIVTQLIDKHSMKLNTATYGTLGSHGFYGCAITARVLQITDNPKETVAITNESFGFPSRPQGIAHKVNDDPLYLLGLEDGFMYEAPTHEALTGRPSYDDGVEDGTMIKAIKTERDANARQADARNRSADFGYTAI